MLKLIARNSLQKRTFSLTADQQTLKEISQKFTLQHITPVAAHYDKTMEYPKPVLKQLWENGLMNLHIPVEYGGQGLSVTDCAIVSEELAFGCSGIQTAAEANGLAVLFIN